MAAAVGRNERERKFIIECTPLKIIMPLPRVVSGRVELSGKRIEGAH